MKRVALLGCGAIGTKIAVAIDTKVIPAVLTHVYDASRQAADNLVEQMKNKPKIVENAHLLSSYPVDIVVEAASQDAVRDVALSVLQNKRDLMIMSVGALLDESIHEVLADACKDFSRIILLPSGAIAGLDAIRSVKAELDSISITTTKHPSALKGAKFFDDSSLVSDLIDTSTTIFDGTARQAVQLFPANINVAALLSLSGIGSDKTKVRIIADPKTNKNTHSIEVTGSFGKMSFVIENVPDTQNPKTSKLAMLSAIETLKEYCVDGIRIGT